MAYSSTVNFSRFAVGGERSVWVCEDCPKPEGSEWLNDSDIFDQLCCSVCGYDAEDELYAEDEEEDE